MHRTAVIKISFRLPGERSKWVKTRLETNDPATLASVLRSAARSIEMELNEEPPQPVSDKKAKRRRIKLRRV